MFHNLQNYYKVQYMYKNRRESHRNVYFFKLLHFFHDKRMETSKINFCHSIIYFYTYPGLLVSSWHSSQEQINPQFLSKNNCLSLIFFIDISEWSSYQFIEISSPFVIFVVALISTSFNVLWKSAFGLQECLNFEVSIAKLPSQKALVW